MDYDTFPFKTFFKILKDETQINLIGLDSEEKCKKAWEQIKEEYNKRHPNPKEVKLVSAYKKVLRESIAANRDISLLTYLTTNPDNLEKLYQDLGISWLEDDDKRISALTKKISKATQKAEIYAAQLKKVEQEIEQYNEEDSKETTISSINEAIASLNLTGFTITDFESITCGQYDAYSKVATKKANANKR